MKQNSDAKCIVFAAFTINADVSVPIDDNSSVKAIWGHTYQAGLH